MWKSDGIVPGKAHVKRDAASARLARTVHVHLDGQDPILLRPRKRLRSLNHLELDVTQFRQD